MADKKISVTYFNTGKKNRITRCDSVDEVRQRIQQQFSLEGNFSLKAKIGDDEYDIDTQQDVADLIDADELIVYSKEETVVNADKLVKIEDEEFRIDVIPLPTATLVQRHRNLLVHDLDLPSMVKELQDLKSFLRLAYYGTATSADVQIGVQEVGFTVTKLCEHSKLTLGMFSSNCGDILEKLRCAYLYLIDGLDEMTLLNFKNVADIAQRMTKTSVDLKQLFDEGVEKAKLALVATQKEKAAQQKMKNKAVAKKKEVNEEKEIKAGDLPNYDMLLAAAVEDVKIRENDLNYKRQKEAKISENEQLSHIFLELMKDKEIPSTTAEKQLREAVERKRVMTQKRFETNEKIRRFISTVKTLEETEEIADYAISALHEAVSGMKGLSDIMLKAELFWTSLSAVVDSMMNESDSLKEKVTTSAEYEKAEQCKLWRSNTFKMEAFKYLSTWVAVLDICSSHKGDMDGVTKGLHEFLRENPTREEAAIEIRNICLDFERRLEVSDAELKRREQNCKEEMNRRLQRISQAKPKRHADSENVIKTGSKTETSEAPPVCEMTSGPGRRPQEGKRLSSTQQLSGPSQASRPAPCSQMKQKEATESMDQLSSGKKMPKKKERVNRPDPTKTVLPINRPSDASYVEDIKTVPSTSFRTSEKQAEPQTAVYDNRHPLSSEDMKRENHHYEEMVKKQELSLKKGMKKNSLVKAERYDNRHPLSSEDMKREHHHYEEMVKKQEHSLKKGMKKNMLAKAERPPESMATPRFFSEREASICIATEDETNRQISRSNMTTEAAQRDMTQMNKRAKSLIIEGQDSTTQRFASSNESTPMRENISSQVSWKDNLTPRQVTTTAPASSMRKQAWCEKPKNTQPSSRRKEQPTDVQQNKPPTENVVSERSRQLSFPNYQVSHKETNHKSNDEESAKVEITVPLHSGLEKRRAVGAERKCKTFLEPQAVVIKPQRDSKSPYCVVTKTDEEIKQTSIEVQNQKPVATEKVPHRRTSYSQECARIKANQAWLRVSSERSREKHFEASSSRPSSSQVQKSTNRLHTAPRKTSKTSSCREKGQRRELMNNWETGKTQELTITQATGQREKFDTDLSEGKTHSLPLAFIIKPMSGEKDDRARKQMLKKSMSTDPRIVMSGTDESQHDTPAESNKKIGEKGLGRFKKERRNKEGEIREKNGQGRANDREARECAERYEKPRPIDHRKMGEMRVGGSRECAEPYEKPRPIDYRKMDKMRVGSSELASRPEEMQSDIAKSLEKVQSAKSREQMPARYSAEQIPRNSDGSDKDIGPSSWVSMIRSYQNKY